jgi:anthranilate/para-aminobenzoate synthase component I
MPTAQLDSADPTNAGWPCSGRAQAVLRCEPDGQAVALSNASGVCQSWRDPLAALAWLEADVRTRGRGARWVGFLSYDLGRLFERIPSAALDDVKLPLFEFALLERSQDRDALRPRVVPSAGPTPPMGMPASTFARSGYLDAVQRAIEYIRAGDVFQVNLSQRFSAALREPPERVYARLLASAPARYGGLLDFGDCALICNSPELFLRVTRDRGTGERRVITRPIKGTRPRRPRMEAELRDSAKDAAELNMIVDLERNDLGRVCRVGSVKVTEPRTIETHPTVLHGVATIEGTLRDDVSFVDLLSATFPGGSITGAPKIRAMQIIEELEPVRRGPYCGAIGYLDADGSIEFNVAIRTMIAKDGRIHIPVGGGIVADSVPAAEYDETLVKARAMFAALGLSLPAVPGRIEA